MTDDEEDEEDEVKVKAGAFVASSRFSKPVERLKDLIEVEDDDEEEEEEEVGRFERKSGLDRRRIVVED